MLSGLQAILAERSVNPNASAMGMTPSEVGDAMPDADAAAAINDLAAHVPSESLEELLEDPRSERLVEELPPRQRRWFLEQLAAFVVRSEHPRYRWLPRVDFVPPDPPRDPDALATWLEKHSLTEWLGAPARVLRPWLERQRFFNLADREDPFATVGDVLRGKRLPRGVPPRGSLAAAYSEAARRFLQYRAIRGRIEKEREKRWAKRPSARMRALAAYLAEAHRHISAIDDSDLPVLLDGSERIEVDTETPALLVSFPPAFAGGSGTQLSLPLNSAGDAAHAVLVDGKPSELEPAKQRALIEWARDIVHRPDHPLHAALVAALGEPPWARLVSAIAEIVEESPEEQTAPREERLVWRVERPEREVSLLGLGHALPKVEAAVQKRLKSGRWSSGRTIGPDELLTTAPPDDSHDLRVLDALLAEELVPAERGRGRSRAAQAALQARARTLRTLVGHPRVYAGDGKRRTQIIESTPHVALVPESDGLTPILRVGSMVVATADVRPGLVVVSSDRTIEIATVDDRCARVFGAVAQYPAAVPSAAHDRLVELLVALQPETGLGLPHALRGAPHRAGPRIVVQLRPDEDDEGLRLTLRVRPLPGGVVWPPGEGPSLVFGVAEGARAHTQRDLDAEREAAENLVDALALWTRRDRGRFQLRARNLEASLDLLAQLEQRASAEEVSLEWPQRRGWHLGGELGAGSLRVRVGKADRYFGITGEAEHEGQRVPLEALMRAARDGSRYVALGKGRFARLEADLRKRLAALEETTHLDDEAEDASTRVLSESGAEVLDGLGAEGVELERDESFTRAQERRREAPLLDPRVPGDFSGDLRDYQEEGFRWLARLAHAGAGAVLADEMGLGKTVQTLATLSLRAERGPSLVVAPTSVMAGWLQEAERFAPSLARKHYHGGDRELGEPASGELVVTSYEVLSRDIDALAGVRWGSVVFDEAQAMKNARTRRAKAARRLDAEWRLGLTGTPLENHLGELWSLFDVVSPGSLGGWSRFRTRFAIPIERDGNHRRRDELAERIRPRLLRRRKADVARELPPRTEVLRPIELTADERVLYEAARQQALDGLKSVGQAKPKPAARKGRGARRFEILAALTRLRRLACHPRLVDELSTAPSAKLESFLELVDELQEDGHRALVFSQFTSHLALVREALDRRGIESLYLDGKTPAAERSRLVDQWQESSVPIFLLSLKAGGTGLNLTAADTVVHLDPWWNPASEDQASDRAHRIGQDKPVTIVRLVTQGTIEETVVALHREKRELADALLAGADLAASFSPEELAALISGPSLIADETIPLPSSE